MITMTKNWCGNSGFALGARTAFMLAAVAAIWGCSSSSTGKGTDTASSAGDSPGNVDEFCVGQASSLSPQQCFGFVNVPAADKPQFESRCPSSAGDAGSFTATACPTENLIGCCTEQSGAVNCYYKSATNMETLAQYEDFCASMLAGTWTTRPATAADIPKSTSDAGP
jgi:hypothetical protein